MSLVQAAWQGHLDEVKRLIDSKANPNEVEDHQTPLQAAVQNNQSEVVFWLLNRCRKVDVNQQDEQGWTPLLSAAVDGRYTICRALLSLKALKVGIFNSEQNGSLIYLCKRPPSLEDREIYEEILGLLLQRGIDLNHRNRFGEAAVHYAAMNNNHLALRFLYDNRCNVNAINNRGETPLHYALSARPQADTVLLLIRQGANPEALSNSGKPLTSFTTIPEILKLLQENRSYDSMIKKSLESYKDIEKELIETSTLLSNAKRILSEHQQAGRRPISNQKSSSTIQMGTIGRSSRRAHKQLANELELQERMNEQFHYARAGPWYCCVHHIKCQDEEDMEAIFSSLHFIDEVSHQNVLSVIQLSKVSNQVQMFVSFPSSTLAEYLNQTSYASESGVLDPETITQFALDMALGLQCLHEAGVVHRSLHPQLVYVITQEKEKGVPPYLALGPFFMAKRDAQWQVNKENEVFFSSTNYLAPEIRNGDRQRGTLPGDIWSLGIILFQMLTMQEPYGDSSLSSDDKNERPELPSNLRGERERGRSMSVSACRGVIDPTKYQHLIDMFQVCTNLEPSQRPTAAAVVKALSSGVSIKEMCGLSLQRGTGSQKDWLETQRTSVRLASMENSPLIHNTPGFNIESPISQLQEGELATDTNPSFIQYLERGVAYYANLLALITHENYAGASEDQSSIIIVSIEVEGQFVDNQYSYRALLRTKDEDIRILVCCETPKDRLRALRQHPMIVDYVLQQLKDPSAKDLLIDFERKHLESKQYKFGVVYRKSGQVLDDDMFSNEHGSEAYEEFLRFLGKKIALKGFEGFRGGLDTASDTTGTHSVYTQFGESFEIMFHTSTLLPYDPENRQQLHRKRHVGNDVIVIIFQDEGSDPFTPSGFASHFNHVFVVVQPARGKCPEKVAQRKRKKEEQPTANRALAASQAYLRAQRQKSLTSSIELVPADAVEIESEGFFYQMSICFKESVKERSRPFLQEPVVFEHDEESRNFFFTKLINSERVSMRSEQFEKRLRNMANLLQRTQLTQNELLAREAEGKKKGLLW